ncbi:MAG: tetratricopeptide repeat protein [Anaerolineae bacterium]|nr:tetratricopeptide repeat protein [Anaerolineae bacterium]
MKIKIWGTRGSIPSPLRSEQIEEKIRQAIYGMPDIDTNNMAEVQAYVSELPTLARGTAGGNTSCVEIQTRGEIFVIDAGSGIRELGRQLMNGPFGRGEGKLHLFFSHAHWDHLQGFPFFAPNFVSGNEIFIYSIHDLETALRDQQRALNFPISLDYMQATFRFIQLTPGQPFTIGKVTINTIENPHPGKAYSYRFQDEHCAFVYASDAEFQDLSDASVNPHIAFFRGADALIFDAQYTLRESWEKVDWGHSSALIGVDFARAAGVKKLILFHHDPIYSDAQLEEIQATAVAYQEQDNKMPSCEVLIGYEGLALDLTPTGAVEFQVMSDQATAVVTPTSVFDERGVDQVAQQLAQLAEHSTLSDSIIDLSHVETLTTATLKMLVTLGQAEGNGSIVLVAPLETIMRVIELAGYRDVFAIYPSVDAAIEALQARKTLNLPGQIINERYLIEGKIGTSRLGTLLKATDTQLKRTVAIKILSAALSDQTLKKFTRQAHQLIDLDQPSVVRVYEVGSDENFTFIVEEFVAEDTLQDFFDRPVKILSVDQALDIALDITLALENIHSRGLTHGNLKPGNIFLTAHGVKLSDVGLGRLEEGRTLLDAPLLHLAAAYLAPEQILGQPIDARTDLYALGVVLFQLFTGQLPYSGTDQEILQAHLHQAPHPPREINADISPSLEHLILKLLINNPSARYSSAEQARRVSSSLIVNVNDLKQPRKMPLIDRDKPLKILHSYWQQVQNGQGQLVFVTGEPGVGKTSLVQQFAAECEPPVLLIGRCQEPESSPTYHPFTEALRAYFATVPPELFNEEVRQNISHFSRLVPEIYHILPDLPKPPILGPKQEQLRLMSNLTQFIKQATEERAWLLILDDLHWADRSSLDLLRYLAHHLPTMGLMIVATYRDEELERGHALLDTLRDLSSSPAYRTLTLGRLEQDGVARILENIWKQPSPPALTAKIYEQTAGNPFYVEEVAKTLVDDGLIIAQAGEWHFPDIEEVRLPRSVREAVWRRIHYLSPDTQSLLRQAAVLGLNFRFEDLREMSGLSEWEVLEHLDVALERQLLWEEPTFGESMLCFSHVEVQYVLYDDMGPLRRRMLHRQAGEALERRALADLNPPAEELAHHFCNADEFDKALVYSIQAARQAQADYANEAALIWYTNTLDMLNQLSPAEAASFQRLRLPVHKFLGQVLTLIGRYDEALNHYVAARALVEAEEPSPAYSRQLADLCCSAAIVHEKRSEYETAFKELEIGLDYLGEDIFNNEAARIYLVGARTFDHQGKLERSIDWCQKSLAIVSQIKSRESQQIMAQVFNRLSAICLLRGYFDVVIHFSRESIAIHQEIDNPPGEVSPYNHLGVAYFLQGNWTKAEESYMKSLTIAKKVGDIDGYSRASNNLADIYFCRGEWDKTFYILRENCATWRQIGMAKDEAKTLSRMAQVHIYRQEWADALTCLARSHSIFTEVGANDYIPELERRWGEYCIGTGEINRALDYLNRAVERAVQQHNPLQEGKSRRMLGEALLAQHKVDEAITVLNHSLTLLTDFDMVYEAARTKVILSRALAITGDQEKAQALLNAAIDLFKRLGAASDLAKAEAIE